MKELSGVVGWAAENENLAMLKWLKEKKFSLNEDTFFWAAQHGSPEIVEWLKESPLPDVIIKQGQEDETIAWF